MIKMRTNIKDPPTSRVYFAYEDVALTTSMMAGSAQCVFSVGLMATTLRGEIPSQVPPPPGADDTDSVQIPSLFLLGDLCPPVI